MVHSISTLLSLNNTNLFGEGGEFDKTNLEHWKSYALLLANMTLHVFTIWTNQVVLQNDFMSHGFDFKLGFVYRKKKEKDQRRSYNCGVL